MLHGVLRSLGTLFEASTHTQNYVGEGYYTLSPPVVDFLARPILSMGMQETSTALQPDLIKRV